MTTAADLNTLAYGYSGAPHVDVAAGSIDTKTLAYGFAGAPFVAATGATGGGPGGSAAVTYVINA